MSNLGCLIKLSLRKAFTFNRQARPREKAFFAFLFLIGYLLLMGFLFFVSSSMISNVKSVGYSYLVITMMMIVASVFCLVTNIYRGSGMLFNATDYQILLSLPIKTRDIIISKIIAIYLFNLDVTVTLMIPTIIAYAVNVSPELSFYLLFLVACLFIPMIPLFFSTIISVIMAVLSKKFRHSNLLQVLFILLIVFGLLFFALSLTSGVDVEAVLNFIYTFNTIYPLPIWFTSGIIGNLFSLLLFCLLNSAFFILLVALFSRLYLPLQSILSSTKENKVKPYSYKQRSVNCSLYFREIKKYFGLPMYFLNTSVGIFLVMFLSFIAMFQLPVNQYVTERIIELLPFIIASFVGLSTTTGCSVSLEGKTLSQLKMLPVKEKYIFQAKIFLNLTMTIPGAIFCGICLNIAFAVPIISGIMLFVLPSVYGIVASQMGLIINLLFPDLNWKNEVSVVKQSTAALFSMTNGVLFPIIFFVLCYVFSFDVNVMLMIFIALCIVSIPLLKCWMSNYGKKIYQAL